MTPTDKKASDKPWHVMCGDVIHSGHADESMADNACAAANSRATELGISARYTVRAKAAA